ncbi:adenosylcobyric acid synthase (glutamine-hydrolysing) [Sphingopyxis sp. YR583]|uniref:cobyric acid synthase n=1 Tax=Sphingopyxis sp. YR583 TaxID=1881047 RepID=UPI0008A7E00D|nr:cobyric acid synthase [Sphingopyxis sp. YR583]SEH14731.1 adenosylcobyric acid synthase (glutamine-hydrolysing) [Sphingopyxis sp. YR583]
MAALMLQGTGSDVGKSVLVAALCRALTNRGLTVRPFKPQNMSNNAAVTADGGEMGRAQALQAIACRAEPHSDMNPVLLKPQADRTSQLIVHGRVRGTLGSGNFREARGALMTEVLESYERLQSQCDIVIVEGAGSPAEINLRQGDIANMGFARAADVPVILIGDIDRGGVIASIVGTRMVIEPEDAAMIRGFLINKFRGDPALFDDGYREIERRSGWAALGVIPWLSAAARLPSEDAVILERPADPREGRKLIACPILPRISNFDDLDPLKLEPGVEIVMVPPGRPIPAETAVIILPGSKATIADLAALRAEGWDIDIMAHHRRGRLIVGLCGGYQMLGHRIADPLGIEGAAGDVEGLGLLDVETTLSPAKRLRHVDGTALGAPVAGYEMHMGETRGPGTERPFAFLEGAARDGAINAEGNVIGSYLHGVFTSPELRRALLSRIGVAGGGRDYATDVDAALDDIAAEFAAHADIDAMLRIAGVGA